MEHAGSAKPCPGYKKVINITLGNSRALKLSVSVVQESHHLFVMEKSSTHILNAEVEDSFELRKACGFASLL